MKIGKYEFKKSLNIFNFKIFLTLMFNVFLRHNLRINRRHLRDISDPLSMPESLFKGIYRFSRQLANDLILEIGPHLREIHREEISIPIKMKVL